MALEPARQYSPSHPFRVRPTALSLDLADEIGVPTALAVLAIALGRLIGGRRSPPRKRGGK